MGWGREIDAGEDFVGAARVTPTTDDEANTGGGWLVTTNWK
jgi:hypothetical protein